VIVKKINVVVKLKHPLKKSPNLKTVREMLLATYLPIFGRTTIP